MQIELSYADAQSGEWRGEIVIVATQMRVKVPNCLLKENSNTSSEVETESGQASLKSSDPRRRRRCTDPPPTRLSIGHLAKILVELGPCAQLDRCGRPSSPCTGGMDCMTQRDLAGSNQKYPFAKTQRTARQRPSLVLRTFYLLCMQVVRRSHACP